MKKKVLVSIASNTFFRDKVLEMREKSTGSNIYQYFCFIRVNNFFSRALHVRKNSLSEAGDDICWRTKILFLIDFFQIGCKYKKYATNTFGREFYSQQKRSIVFMTSDEPLSDFLRRQGCIEYARSAVSADR